MKNNSKSCDAAVRRQNKRAHINAWIATGELFVAACAGCVVEYVH